MTGGMIPFAGRSGTSAPAPKIQTGTATVSSGSSPQFRDVVFDEPFATTPVVTPNSTTSVGIATVTTVSATGFRVYLRHYKDAAWGTSNDVTWIAVGV